MNAFWKALDWLKDQGFRVVMGVILLILVIAYAVALILSTVGPEAVAGGCGLLLAILAVVFWKFSQSLSD